MKRCRSASGTSSLTVTNFRSSARHMARYSKLRTRDTGLLEAEVVAVLIALVVGGRVLGGFLFGL